jgi:hypothetical protein
MSGISIDEHVEAHVRPDGPGLTDGGEVLPDDPRPDYVVRMAPGLIDRIVDPGTRLESEQTAASLFGAFKDAIRAWGSGEASAPFARHLAQIEELGFLEPFVRRVFESPLPKRRVRSAALRLVTESTDRLPVKVGIALLGICAHSEDQRVLITIARHPEFTDFAGMALTNAFGTNDELLWELAKVTQDWGRIALVQQLEHTTDPAIRAWILREMGRDYFLLAECSMIGAVTGRLREELEADEIDDDVCLAAGRILQMLIENRPYEKPDSIDGYVDAPEAIRRYLDHLSHRPVRLESIQPLLTILDYLELGGGVDPNVYPKFREPLVARIAGRPLAGWLEDERARAATFARWVLQRPGWRQAIDEGLVSDDRWHFYLAQRAAARLGDDVFPVLLERLQRHPGEEDITWQDAADHADDEPRVDGFLEVALARLSEHRPYDSWRFPGWLRSVRDVLERFPGKSRDLILAGLTSPVVMERRFGISALGILDYPWPDEALSMLVGLARSEPDEDNRDMALELLEDHGFSRSRRDSVKEGVLPDVRSRVRRR